MHDFPPDRPLDQLRPDRLGKVFIELGVRRLFPDIAQDLGHPVDGARGQTLYAFKLDGAVDKARVEVQNGLACTENGRRFSFRARIGSDWPRSGVFRLREKFIFTFESLRSFYVVRA